MKRDTIRKILACLLPLAMALALCSCGKDAGSQSGQSGGPSPGTSKSAVNEWIRERADMAGEEPFLAIAGTLECIRTNPDPANDNICYTYAMPVKMPSKTPSWSSAADLTGAGVSDDPGPLYPGAVAFGYEELSTPMTELTWDIGRMLDEGHEDYSDGTRALYEEYLLDMLLRLSDREGIDAASMVFHGGSGTYDKYGHMEAAFSTAGAPDYDNSITVDVSDCLNGIEVELVRDDLEAVSLDDCLLLCDLFGMPITLDELSHMADLARAEAEQKDTEKPDDDYGHIGSSGSIFHPAPNTKVYINLEYYSSKDGSKYRLQCSRSINLYNEHDEMTPDCCAYRDLLAAGVIK